ncbi:MAG: para-nitrobenzyl esterase [Polaribacter sp.]|jgi:para-nitrobenzyl esterase
MQLKNLHLLFFLLSFTALNAQNHPTCDGARYIEDVFTDVEVTEGINFGSATTISGNAKELDMDIYEPSGDVVENRPVIILGFGGSFIGGTRQDLDFLCRAYAKKGFVAVTIDYRLYDGSLLPLPSAETMQDVVTKTVADFKAAVRFFREDADGTNEYGVDPNLVFLGGVSAGGIAAAHAAVMDDSDTYSDELEAIITANGGLEGNSSDNLQYSSEVQGFVNFSGGLGDADWIDENDPPFFSIHDDMDGTVPYGEGFASIFGFDIIAMDGSQIMSQVADANNVLNELVTIEGSTGHVSYFGSQPSTTESIDASSVFLENLICNVIVMTNASEVNSPLNSLIVYPNPTEGMLFLKGEETMSLSITLRDVLGKEMMYLENVRSLDLSAVAKGMYFVEVKNLESLDVVVKRVVVE